MTLSFTLPAAVPSEMQHSLTRRSFLHYDLPPSAKILLQLHDAPSSEVERNPLKSHIQAPTQTLSFLPFATIRALSAAPFVATYAVDSSYLACAEEFFEDNPLIPATLKNATQDKYAVALENFKASSVANESTHLSLDQRLSIYIQEPYTANSRPGQRQEMSNLVCMISLMYPSIKLDLGLARSCISGWRTLKPARSSAPFTKKMVLALAWAMLSKGNIHAATVLLTSLSACLRVSEAFKITWKHVALPGDLRLAAYPPGTAGVNIKDAKTARYTGKLQFVKITDEHGIKLLTELQRRGASTSRRIAPISYQQYSESLKQALAVFKLQDASFTSHCARIGKATEDFIKGDEVEQIAIHGRWKSLNSLRYYLNNGRAWILDTPISDQQQQTLREAAEKMKKSLSA